jgi:hypothetical protein
MRARQLKEVVGANEANRYLKKGWKLLRCLVQQTTSREVVVFVLINP